MPCYVINRTGYDFLPRNKPLEDIKLIDSVLADFLPERDSVLSVPDLKQPHLP